MNKLIFLLFQSGVHCYDFKNNYYWKTNQPLTIKDFIKIFKLRKQ